MLNDREALLGASICGVLERPAVFLDPATLEAGAATCLAVDAAVADHIGIAQAARVTCVKPEGTASLVLGAASGIHPHHARLYVRRVQAARTDAVYQWFKSINPHLAESSVWDPDTTDVITFPVAADDDAILREDVGAVQFLEYVTLVQQHWVEAGRRHERYNPGLHHNVSNTVAVRDAEWNAMQRFIWQNRAHFAGISLLRETGDKRHAQAPREAMTTEEDMSKWNALHDSLVDCAAMRETHDVTARADITACVGGSCELT